MAAYTVAKVLGESEDDALEAAQAGALAKLLLDLPGAVKTQGKRFVQLWDSAAPFKSYRGWAVISARIGKEVKGGAETGAALNDKRITADEVRQRSIARPVY